MTGLVIYSESTFTLRLYRIQVLEGLLSYGTVTKGKDMVHTGKERNPTMESPKRTINYLSIKTPVWCLRIHTKLHSY